MSSFKRSEKKKKKKEREREKKNKKERIKQERVEREREIVRWFLFSYIFFFFFHNISGQEETGAKDCSNGKPIMHRAVVATRLSRNPDRAL